MAGFSVQTLSQAINANRTAGTSGPGSSRFNKKVAENLNVRWRSIEYKKTLYNPAQTSNKQSRAKAEDLSLSFEIEMPNSGLILSTCPDAVIEQITDSRGNNIEAGPFSARSSLMYVHIPRFNGGFMPAERPGRPELPGLRVRLDPGLRERTRGQIGLKGYFYALIAESLEYVELPFKPSDKWVRLTPDMEIRVREARNEASMYKFHIEWRPEIVPRLAGMQVGDPLPSRLVVDRQTIAQTSSVGSGGVGSFGGTGIGEKGFGVGKAEKIRYTIAVNPAHQTIPFEIERIPLSALAEPVPSQPRSSNQTAPFRRQMQNITRRGARRAAQRMPEQVKPQFNKEVADCFEVNWNSIIYSKTLYNPAVSRKSREQKVSEKLAVRCQAKILDSELVVGTCDIPVIERITDGKGRDTDISRTEPRSNRMYYNTPRYQPSLIPTPPSSLIYWEGRARLALGLPLKARHRPKRSLELQPVHLGIQLDPGLLRQDPGEIGSIKGYFHALTAKSLKHVKVPFKSSDKWVRLTPDVEIQLPKVRQRGLSSQFEIKQRRQAGRHVSRLLVGDRWPNEIVADWQFIGTGGPANSLGSRGGQQLPGSISSSGSISGRQVEKIDFVIAVGPTHNRIPFEIEHIPKWYSANITRTRNTLEKGILNLEKEKRAEYVSWWRNLVLVKRDLINSVKEFKSSENRQSLVVGLDSEPKAESNYFIPQENDYNS